MRLLASGLGPFVNKAMAAAVPGSGDWVEILAARNPSRDGAGHRRSLSDPRFLLRVVTEEWRVFKDQLSRVEQGFATELRDAGNRWAHGEPFSGDDTYRALDTMERLLSAIGAAEQAGKVRGLRLDLQESVTEAATPSCGVRPAPPGPLPPGGEARMAGFWSRVARPDVVRAIEEYDRLGQDEFLAEHGFGRATAYLLFYRGRSYDSKAILGVAYKVATGVPIGAHDFSGGVYGAARVLRRLGFEVRNVRDSAAERAGAGKINPLRTEMAAKAPALDSVAATPAPDPPHPIGATAAGTRNRPQASLDEKLRIAGADVMDAAERLRVLGDEIGLPVVAEGASLRIRDWLGSVVLLYPTYRSLEFDLGVLRRRPRGRDPRPARCPAADRRNLQAGNRRSAQRRLPRSSRRLGGRRRGHPEPCPDSS